jgi:hypothetical protein
MDHDDMPDTMRPDRIGIIVTECGSIMVDTHVIRILTFTQADNQAHHSPEAAAWIREATAQGTAIVIALDNDRTEILFDQARYPSITTNDIEVAFCYEQSQDAEELKLIGAVTADYRRLTWAEAEQFIRDQHAE